MPPTAPAPAPGLRSNEPAGNPPEEVQDDPSEATAVDEGDSACDPSLAWPDSNPAPLDSDTVLQFNDAGDVYFSPYYVGGEGTRHDPAVLHVPGCLSIRIHVTALDFHLEFSDMAFWQAAPLDASTASSMGIPALCLDHDTVFCIEHLGSNGTVILRDFHMTPAVQLVTTEHAPVTLTQTPGREIPFGGSIGHVGENSTLRVLGVVWFGIDATTTVEGGAIEILVSRLHAASSWCSSMLPAQVRELFPLPLEPLPLAGVIHPEDELRDHQENVFEPLAPPDPSVLGNPLPDTPEELDPFLALAAQAGVPEWMYQYLGDVWELNLAAYDELLERAEPNLANRTVEPEMTVHLLDLESGSALVAVGSEFGGAFTVIDAHEAAVKLVGNVMGCSSWGIVGQDSQVISVRTKFRELLVPYKLDGSLDVLDLDPTLPPPEEIPEREPAEELANQTAFVGRVFLSVCDIFSSTYPAVAISDSVLTLFGPNFQDGLPLSASSAAYAAETVGSLDLLVPVPDNIRMVLPAHDPADVGACPAMASCEPLQAIGYADVCVLWCDPAAVECQGPPPCPENEGPLGFLLCFLCPPASWQTPNGSQDLMDCVCRVLDDHGFDYAENVTSKLEGFPVLCEEEGEPEAQPLVASGITWELLDGAGNPTGDTGILNVPLVATDLGSVHYLVGAPTPATIHFFGFYNYATSAVVGSSAPGFGFRMNTPGHGEVTYYYQEDSFTEDCTLCSLIPDVPGLLLRESDEIETFTSCATLRVVEPHLRLVVQRAPTSCGLANSGTAGSHQHFSGPLLEFDADIVPGAGEITLDIESIPVYASSAVWKDSPPHEALDPAEPNAIYIDACISDDADVSLELAGEYIAGGDLQIVADLVGADAACHKFSSKGDSASSGITFTYRTVPNENLGAKFHEAPEIESVLLTLGGEALKGGSITMWGGPFSGPKNLQIAQGNVGLRVGFESTQTPETNKLPLGIRVVHPDVEGELVAGGTLVHDGKFALAIDFDTSGDTLKLDVLTGYIEAFLIQATAEGEVFELRVGAFDSATVSWGGEAMRAALATTRNPGAYSGGGGGSASLEVTWTDPAEGEISVMAGLESISGEKRLSAMIDGVTKDFAASMTSIQAEFAEFTGVVAYVRGGDNVRANLGFLPDLDGQAEFKVHGNTATDATVSAEKGAIALHALTFELADVSPTLAFEGEITAPLIQKVEARWQPARFVQIELPRDPLHYLAGPIMLGAEMEIHGAAPFPIVVELEIKDVTGYKQFTYEEQAALRTIRAVSSQPEPYAIDLELAMPDLSEPFTVGAQIEFYPLPDGSSEWSLSFTSGAGSAPAGAELDVAKGVIGSWNVEGSFEGKQVQLTGTLLSQLKFEVGDAVHLIYRVASNPLDDLAVSGAGLWLNTTGYPSLISGGILIGLDEGAFEIDVLYSKTDDSTHITGTLLDADEVGVAGGALAFRSFFEPFLHLGNFTFVADQTASDHKFVASLANGAKEYSLTSTGGFIREVNFKQLGFGGAEMSAEFVHSFSKKGADTSFHAPVSSSGFSSADQTQIFLRAGGIQLEAEGLNLLEVHRGGGTTDLKAINLDEYGMFNFKSDVWDVIPYELSIVKGYMDVYSIENNGANQDIYCGYKMGYKVTAELPTYSVSMTLVQGSTDSMVVFDATPLSPDQVVKATAVDHERNLADHEIC